jgi:endonuclease/exonuclease/phosphatase family metal-dependent hydrolase
MRTVITSVVLVLVVALAVPSTTANPTSAAQRRVPDIQVSPPGQIAVVTLNLHSYPVLGLHRFTAMYELSRSLRRRPLAFDGGYDRGVHAPDVIPVNEIRPSNLEIFVHILRQRFGVKYRVAGPDNAAAALVFNPDTVSLVGDVIQLQDACSDPSDERFSTRSYPVGRFVETQTNLPFAVASIHFPKRYPEERTDCFSTNINQLRMLFETEQTPTILAGDFNRRARTDTYECDPNEESEPLSWWSALTAPDNGGRQYLDTVYDFNRANTIRMDHEWTHEQRTSQIIECTGGNHVRRSRIDYIFAADAEVAEAHADHPGWAGTFPGDPHPINYKYSDHRWVWGRYVLSGPPRPTRPNAVAQSGGEIEVSWEPVDGVTEWIVYRALGKRDFGVLARLPADVTMYEDRATDHARSYRYLIAAVGPDTGQGVESRGESAVADARGPIVVGTDPPRGAEGVGPGKSVTVRFNEGVREESIDHDAVRLYVSGHRVAGFVIRKAPRFVKFNPQNPLKKGKTYTGVVSGGLLDRVGNTSQPFTWRFEIEKPPPPKKKKKGRRRR